MTTKTVYTLNNINLLTQSQYENIENAADGELYAVEGVTITDYAISGTEWYRQYSDGFIEQGGELGSSGAGSVTFQTEFQTTSYNVIITPLESTNNIPYITSRSIAGFTISPENISFLWEAKGY